MSDMIATLLKFKCTPKFAVNQGNNDTVLTDLTSSLRDSYIPFTFVISTSIFAKNSFSSVNFRFQKWNVLKFDNLLPV